MEHTRTDCAPRSVTLTAFDFAMEEVTAASSSWPTNRPAKKKSRCRYDRAGVCRRSFGLRKNASPVSAGAARRRAARLTSQRSWGSSGRA